MLMVNSATATSVGSVSSTKKGEAKLALRLPICAKREAGLHYQEESALVGD